MSAEKVLSNPVLRGGGGAGVDEESVRIDRDAETDLDSEHAQELQAEFEQYRKEKREGLR